MQLYAITQRSLFAGDQTARAKALRDQAQVLAKGGVHYLQIREKDLPQAALRSLSTSIVEVIRSENGKMKVLLNGPAAIALEAGCDGVHLTGNATPQDALDARRLFSENGRSCFVSAACHSIPEISSRSQYADLLLFAPVFEKRTSEGSRPGVGLKALSQAVHSAQNVPVLALGGVTARNAAKCTQAGAAGIAAIRLFLQNDWVPLTHR